MERQTQINARWIIGTIVLYGVMLFLGINEFGALLLSLCFVGAFSIIKGDLKKVISAVRSNSK